MRDEHRQMLDRCAHDVEAAQNMKEDIVNGSYVGKKFPEIVTKNIFDSNETRRSEFVSNSIFYNQIRRAQLEVRQEVKTVDKASKMWKTGDKTKTNPAQSKSTAKATTAKKNAKKSTGDETSAMAEWIVDLSINPMYFPNLQPKELNYFGQLVNADISQVIQYFLAYYYKYHGSRCWKKDDKRARQPILAWQTIHLALSQQKGFNSLKNDLENPSQGFLSFVELIESDMQLLSKHELAAHVTYKMRVYLLCSRYLLAIVLNLSMLPKTDRKNTSRNTTNGRSRIPIIRWQIYRQKNPSSLTFLLLVNLRY
eukprot:scaffold107563_cov52-Cyclotella_meneghiniana.AAC.3